MRRRGWIVGLTSALMTLAMTGCTAGPETRIVLVDFRHDEFESSFIGFFPDRVEVHAGDTVSFSQTWTGEPHSVTFGAAFNDELGTLIEMRRQGATVANPAPGTEALADLPVILGRADEPFALNQNGAQPCYLEAGLPPADPEELCPEVDQPDFDGRHSYYSSGFLPYEGPDTSFDVRLADDIAPGTYNFFCTLHGVGQSTSIAVQPAETSVPSASEVAREARRQIETRFTQPLADALTQARGGELSFRDMVFPTPLAGVGSDTTLPWTGLVHRGHLHDHGTVNEFVPGQVRTRTGEPVTWTFVGRHTISFNVPRYFPIFSVDGGGAVRINPGAHEPVVWPGRPPEGPRDQPAAVDAGAWDGRGFRSSGLDWETGDRFSVTFTEPGTYAMACLIHPGMVGEVQVRPP
jgi:plastocyanin